MAQFDRGDPVFDAKPDTGPKSISGQRKYREVKPRVQLKTDYDESDFHEMQGRFKFELKGTFYQAGEVFESECFKAADDLWLTGYIKSRGSFVTGDLQGDVYALSYMQKWLEQGHHSEEAGKVESVRLFEENYGVPDLRKRCLVCVKDWRKHYSKRDQFKQKKLTEKVEELKTRSGTLQRARIEGMNRAH